MGVPYEGNGTGDRTGVTGTSSTGDGVVGASTSGAGVLGRSGGGSSVRPGIGCGVWGDSTGGYGVFAASQDNDAIHCDCSAATHAAVVAINHATGGTGIVAQASGNAGVFKGNVSVTGDISVSGDVLLTGQDCAEQFDLTAFERADPGTVMVLDHSGALRQSTTPYDRCVAGVVSGAGDYRPGIVLGQQASAVGRAAIALVGKVFCKVDADAEPVAVGDLLTTSATPGHAMKATNPQLAFGAVIGKALRPLEAGRQLLPILVALQ